MISLSIKLFLVQQRKLRVRMRSSLYSTDSLSFFSVCHLSGFARFQTNGLARFRVSSGFLAERGKHLIEGGLGVLPGTFFEEWYLRCNLGLLCASNIEIVDIFKEKSRTLYL